MADLLGLRIGGVLDNKSGGGGGTAASQVTVDTGTNTTEFVNPATLANASFHGKYHKNLLYHSLTHHIWQEGDTFNDIADDTYVADLWNVVHNGQAPDITSVAGSSTDPLKRFFRCTFDSASSQAGIVQFLTSTDTVPLRGEKVSISADLWGTGITTLRMAVLEWQNPGDTITSDVVGTWGVGNPTLATNWVYLGTPAAITITTGRARYEVENLTVGIGANNLAVFIWTDAEEASGDLFNVARVQLERGPVATEFVARKYPEELGLCQPFAYGITDATAITTFENGTQTSGSTIDWAFVLPVPMFAVPSLSHDATGYGTGATQIAAYNYNLATNATASSLSFTFQSGTKNVVNLRLGNITNGSSPNICQLVIRESVRVVLRARL